MDIYDMLMRSTTAALNMIQVHLQGEISILAHSLGSVLCYDVLCNQPHLFASLMESHKNVQTSKPEAVALSSFGSMQPMQSSDLDPSKPQQAGTSRLNCCH